MDPIKRGQHFNVPMSLYITKLDNKFIWLSEEFVFPRMRLLVTVFPDGSFKVLPTELTLDPLPS